MTTTRPADDVSHQTWRPTAEPGGRRTSDASPGGDAPGWWTSVARRLRLSGRPDLSDAGAARWWTPLAVVLAPLLVGWAVGLVLLLRGDEHNLHLHVPVWVTVVTVGLVLTGAVGAVMGVRWLRTRHRRATAAALDQARQRWYVKTRAKDAAFLARLDGDLLRPVNALRAALAALGPPTTGPARVLTDQSARIAAATEGLELLADTENRQLDLARVELVPIIERAVAAVRDELPLAGAETCDILVLSPSEAVVVAGVEDLLSVAIYHLVTNAVKFSDPGTTITVHCVQDGDSATVEVADMGWGIPDAESRDVWEPLVRASNVAQTRGSGIGLSLVRAVVERHGGQVDLVSRLGHGTTVVARLPSTVGSTTGPRG